MKTLLALLGLCGLVGCVRPQHAEPRVNVALISDVPGDALLRRVAWERVVRLGGAPQVLLGGITKVLPIPESTDVVVIDGESGKVAYRFSADGQLLGEYRSTSRRAKILDAVFLENGNLLISKDQVLEEFDASGRSVKVVPVNYAAIAMVVVDGVLCVHVALPKPEDPARVICVDGEYVARRAFGEFEPMFFRYKYQPHSPMFRIGSEIALVSYESTRLELWSPNGRQREAITTDTASESINALRKLLTPQTFGPEERLAVRQQMRRFEWAAAVGRSALLWEKMNADGISNLVHMQTEARWTRYLGVSPQRIADYQDAGLLLTDVVGSWEDGVIGYFSHPGVVGEFGEKYPMLHGPEIVPSANPVLVFLKIQPS